MPKGIYKHKSMSEETKKKLSISLMGRRPKFIPDNRGITRSAETRKKIGDIQRGKKQSPETIAKRAKALIGKIPWNKGKKCPQMSGDKSGGWRGGITPINESLRKSLEYRLWRTAVFERDNYTCIWCGQKGGNLHADHIKPFAHYPELRFAIDNGRTLCVTCHIKTDTYGFKSNKKTL